MDEYEIAQKFSVYTPTRHGMATYERLAELMIELSVAIVDMAPDSPERSMAIFKLQEAHMWAAAGIARNLETR